MRVLVTGHNGYIGSVLTGVLKAAGHTVVGLDTYFFEGCGNAATEEDIETLRKDVRDVAAEDLEGFEAVVHLAALCNDPLGDLNPDWTYAINHQATGLLARVAKAAGVRRFLFASSCSMYGKAGEGMMTENSPLRPLTSYAISKVQSEEDLSELAEPDFSPVFMRNATAYGMSPRLRADVVLNNLVCWAHTTGKVKIMSDGTPWRPIVHVEDISRAFAAVLMAPRSVIHNQAFNVGVNEENYQVHELAEIVRETVPGCEVEFAADGGPDPRSYRVSFDKLALALPEFKSAWNARRGAQELYACLQGTALSVGDFQGRRFNRLAQLKHLIESGLLDSSLRWKPSKQATNG